MEGGGETMNIACQGCGGVGFSDGGDVFFYCIHCSSQAEDIIDTAVADEDFVEQSTRGVLYQSRHRRHVPASAFNSDPLASQSLLWSALTRSPKTPKVEPPYADAYPLRAYYPSQSVDVCYESLNAEGLK